MLLLIVFVRQNYQRLIRYFNWSAVSAIRLAVPPKCLTCLLCALFLHLEINLI